MEGKQVRGQTSFSCWRGIGRNWIKTGCKWEQLELLCQSASSIALTRFHGGTAIIWLVS